MTRPVAQLIIKQLDEFVDIKKRSQQILRDFVLDKSYPLEERFRVWTAHCDKNHYEWIIQDQQMPLISAWVHNDEPYEYYKYETWDWERYLGHIKGGELKYDVDEFKELLIETNFGSFTNDW